MLAIWMNDVVIKTILALYLMDHLKLGQGVTCVKVGANSIIENSSYLNVLYVVGQELFKGMSEVISARQ